MIDRLIVELPGRYANQVIAFLSSQYLADHLGIRNARFSRPLRFMGTELIATEQVGGAYLARLKSMIGWGSTIEGHSLSSEKLRPALMRGQTLVLRGYFQRAEYFYEPHLDFFGSCRKTVGALDRPDVPDLTIHVRGGDVWNPGGKANRRVHTDYPALPLSFYQHVRSLESWNRVLVVTDDPDHPYTKVIASMFSARIQSSTRERDLMEIARARNLVLSVSTFALLGALASNAERVFYPVTGLFDEARMHRNRGAEAPQPIPRNHHAFIGVATACPDPWSGTLNDLHTLLDS